jgi:predicted peptidase
MMRNSWYDDVLAATTTIIKNVVATYQGDPSRIYLTGQSMGGNGAWMYASQQRHLFAAVVVICGYAQNGLSRKISARLSSTGVGIYHSADDSVIPVSASDDMASILKIQGHGDFKYWRPKHAPGPPMPEYSDLIGHGVYEISFRDPDLYSWLLGHSCSTCGPELTSWLSLHGERGHQQHANRDLR